MPKSRQHTTGQVLKWRVTTAENQPVLIKKNKSLLAINAQLHFHGAHLAKYSNEFSAGAANASKLGFYLLATTTCSTIIVVRSHTSLTSRADCSATSSRNTDTHYSHRRPAIMRKY